MEGFGAFIVLVLILYFFSLFFTCLFLFRLAKIKTGVLGGIALGFACMIIAILLLRTDLVYMINLKWIFFYSVFIFFAWLVVLAVKQNE